METRVLLISCPDKTGLIACVTSLLNKAGQNIIHNDEHVDPESQTFFMRTEFRGPQKNEDILAGLKKVLASTTDIRLVEKKKRKRIVVLVTKEPHCLGDILIRNHFQGLPGEVLGVIGNHPDLGPLVERFDLPFHAVPQGDLSREKHEAAISKWVDGYQPDYLVLAKFMRILTPGFVQKYRHKIINIHHSFLPAFAGAKPYLQAFRRGVKIIGATAHFVTDSLDEGPIIAQDVIPVDHSLDPKALAKAGQNVERTVLAKAMDLVFDDRVFVFQNKTVVFP